jgi:hypothetical protein
MRHALLLLALVLSAPIESAAQAPACRQPLATLTVPQSSYAEVSGDPLERRVYVYVPAIKAGGGKAFAPFQVWVVEGVYGRPFVKATGDLDQAGFDKLRRSQNVRATPVNVVRGDGSDSGQFRIARETYRVQILKVIASKSAAVQVRVCR